MPDTSNARVLIVSDLHLGEGADPVTGHLDPREDFLDDEPFARFLAHFRNDRDAAANAEPWRLIILGDMIDFWQVQDDRGWYDRTGEAESVEKLNRVVKGHPEFFASLGDWVAADNALVIVMGNHDTELAWEGVQACLREHIVGHAARCSNRQCEARWHEAITFQPWIYYLPNFLYAEHGQQYQRETALVSPLWPFEATPGVLVPGGLGTQPPAQLEITTGAAFVYTLYNKIEERFEDIDNIVPRGPHLRELILAQPVSALVTLAALTPKALPVLYRAKIRKQHLGPVIGEEEKLRLLRDYGDRMSREWNEVLPVEEISQLPSTENGSLIPFKPVGGVGERLSGIGFLLKFFLIMFVVLAAIFLLVDGISLTWTGLRHATMTAMTLSLAIVLVALGIGFPYFAYGLYQSRKSGLELLRQVNASHELFGLLRARNFVIAEKSSFLGIEGCACFAILGAFMLDAYSRWTLDFHSIKDWLLIVGAACLLWLVVRIVLDSVRLRDQAFLSAQVPSLMGVAIAVKGLMEQTTGVSGADAYIFGHTHEPDVWPIETGTRKALYVNTGTWTKIISKEPRLLATGFYPTFVQADARGVFLMEWDDSAGQPRRFRRHRAKSRWRG